MFNKSADGGYTDITKIIIALTPKQRWGIYRQFSNGNTVLWTTHMLRRTAVREGQEEAKKFGLNPEDPTEFEVRD